MAELVPVHCVYCGGTASLQLRGRALLRERPDGTTDEYAKSLMRWACPHCGRENSGEYRGLLAWVTKGAIEQHR